MPAVAALEDLDDNLGSSNSAAERMCHDSEPSIVIYCCLVGDIIIREEVGWSYALIDDEVRISGGAFSLQVWCLGG